MTTATETPTKAAGIFLTWEKLDLSVSKMFRKSHPDQNGLTLFADGAVLSGHIHQAPSPDPYKRNLVCREYLRHVLALEEAGWTKYRNAALAQAQMHQRSPTLPPGVSPGVLETLKAGKERIHLLRQRLRAVEADIQAWLKAKEESDPEYKARVEKQREEMRHHRERFQEFLECFAEVNKLTLD